MSATITMDRPPTATLPFCPWCGLPVLVHPPAVEQRVFGFPLVICSHAPVGEARLEAAWETEA